MPYIKCDGRSCKSVNANDLRDICNSLGDLVTMRNENVYMCIDNDYMIEFSMEDTYMAIPNIKNNIFGNTIYNNYSIIKISQDAIMVVKDTKQCKVFFFFIIYIKKYIIIYF